MKINKRGELVGSMSVETILLILFFIIAAGVIVYFLIKGLT